MNPKLIPNTHIISDDRGMMLTRSESPEARQLLEFGTQHMLRPTRDLLLGVGNKQATPAMNQLPAIYEGGGSTPAAATPAVPRHTEEPTVVKFRAPLQTPPTHLSARVLTSGAGYEQD